MENMQYDYTYQYNISQTTVTLLTNLKNTKLVHSAKILVVCLTVLNDIFKDNSIK